VHLIARAKNRTDARTLAILGVPAVRETFGSALDAARQSLEALGMAHEEAVRVAAQFRAHDELMFAKQVEAWNDQEKLIALADQGRNDLQRLLEEEADQGNTPIDPTPAATASAGSIPATTTAPESR
jgi:hypothetical protein